MEPPIDVDTATSAPLSPNDPAAIGDYRLLGRLGTGGMGTVYLGVSGDDRRVAVKVIRAERSSDPGFTARFRSEVEHARSVASFCTAQVLGHGETADGRPYMVTEFIPGTPLDRQITTYGALEAGTLHGVAFGVAAALTAIHAAGLVHRDLKPANVILSMSGPRVIDFGVSRSVDATHGDTGTGEVVGTPGWWAPEQLQGRPVTPAADIFTWGCLVAYAGNGRHPFGEGDPMVLAHRVLEADPDLGALADPLNRLVRRALDREPRNRPSAQELLLALVGGRSEPATQVIEELWDPPSNLLHPAAPRPASSRGRRLIWLVVAAVAVAVGAGLAVGLLAGRENGGPAAGRADDIGRRIEIGDVQVVVERPACRAAGAGTACRLDWLVLNMGGAAADLAGPPALVDDQGVAHEASGGSTSVPASVQPGELLSAGAEYALPAGRTAVRLYGPVLTGAAPLDVRLGETS
ncbi:serine/threonine-protein kinase [Microbispora sp. NPDC049125]|uniref:serine/threonine-protein kinase n=1 Tax=Microbispora sp. NPDC049125 TaxID=3154929 RepID=UPI0034652AAF